MWKLTKSCILFTTLMLVCLRSVESTLQRIRGGNELTSRKGFAYQISLRYRNEHICGGSILDEQHVITSASCCLDPKNQSLPVSELTVVAGTLKLYNDENTVEKGVEKIFIHEQYVSRYRDNIAIIKLSGKFEKWTDDIAPIEISRTHIVQLEKCKVSGWGAVYKDGNLNPQLKYAESSVILITNCRTCVENYHSNVFCAGNYLNGFYQGDHGGPLVCKDLLAGIASYNVDCMFTNIQDVYTEVAKYTDWIDEQLAKASSEINTGKALISLILFTCISSIFL